MSSTLDVDLCTFVTLNRKLKFRNHLSTSLCKAKARNKQADSQTSPPGVVTLAYTLLSIFKKNNPVSKTYKNTNF